MDPALGVSSPFRDEARALDGVLDNAIEAITGGDWHQAQPLTQVLDNNTSGRASVAVKAAAPRAPTGTPCMVCAEHYTQAKVPADGLYLCPECVAQRTHSSSSFAAEGTFKCCPTSTDVGTSGVMRCAECGGWYHGSCVGITNTLLRDYVSLSTTRWYCPEPECCEKVLARQLKHK